MNKSILFITALFIGFIGIGAVNAAITPQHGGELDLKASTVTWLGKKVVGQHSGNVSIKSGGLKFMDHQLVGGHFIMDMNSITCTDLQGKGAEKLVGHLKNEDFFETAKYGTSEFIMSSATKMDGDVYKIEGNLTIKGITNPLTFEATITETSATATLDIDRTAYDIKYGSGSFFDNLGDKAIDNNFQLTVNLVFK